MGERTDQRTRTEETAPLDESILGGDEQAGPAESPDRTGDTEKTTLRGRVRSRVPTPGTVFSVRSFLLVVVLALAAVFLAGTVLPLGSLAGYLGIALVGFGTGLAGDRRRYLELLVGGGVASAVGTTVGNLVLATLGLGVPLVVLGALGGSVAGVLGHYFGRDLRAGLTRDL
jgi:hypothetical protein